MDISQFVPKLGKKAMEKFQNEFDSLASQFEPDVAMVLAFEKSVLGSTAKNCMKAHFGGMTRNEIINATVDPASVPRAMIGDKEYFLVPKALTTSGVNKLLQYKSKEVLKKTAKNQEGHIIPCVNDHPQRPQVELETHEISGFIFGVHGRDLEDGEYGVFGIDAIPSEYPELLDTYGDSIGYKRKVKNGWNAYKEMEFYEEESDITIVHNARMVNTRPAVPPDNPKFQPGEAHGVGIRPELISGGSGIISEIIGNLNTINGVKAGKSINNCNDNKKDADNDGNDDQDVNIMAGDDQVKDLEKKVDSLNAELKKAREKIAEFESKNQEEVLKQKDEKITELNALLDEKSTTIKDLETKAAENTAEIDRLKPFESQILEQKTAETNAVRKKFKEIMKNDSYWTDEKIEGAETDHLKEVMNAVLKVSGKTPVEDFSFSAPVQDQTNSEEGKEEEGTPEQNTADRAGGSIGLPKRE